MLKSETATDHEDIEIVFAAERGLVPAHRALERLHGVVAAGLLAGLDVDAQGHLAPRRGAEAVLDAGESPADQREQVGGLAERVVPDREMPAGAGHVAGLDQVAVGEQHRRVGFLGLDAGGVDRHHVGPVGKIGDAPEALGLALGAVDRARR
jgi:hypothetical protein